MFDNCANCYYYEKWFDDLYREGDDVADMDGNPIDNHYCGMLRHSGDMTIPTDVWSGETLCPHYAKTK